MPVSPSFVISIRAPRANGIGKKQLKPRPSCGLIVSGSDQKFFTIPWPIPKKSPIGASTHGAEAPSQYARSTVVRAYKGFRGAAIVHQMCRTIPDPATSHNVAVAPAPTTVKSKFPPDRSQLDTRRRFPGRARARSASELPTIGSLIPPFALSLPALSAAEGSKGLSHPSDG